MLWVFSFEFFLNVLKNYFGNVYFVNLGASLSLLIAHNEYMNTPRKHTIIIAIIAIICPSPNSVLTIKLISKMDTI